MPHDYRRPGTVMLMTLLLSAGTWGRSQASSPLPETRPEGQVANPAPVEFRVVDGYLVASLPGEQVTVVARPVDPGAPKTPLGEDKGWASWAQRKDLLWSGTMEDHQGRSYNVRILPGYVAPARHLAEGWEDAASDLGEYGRSFTWNRLGRRTRSSLRWGWEDAFKEFGIKGSQQAWVKHFDAAQRRTERKTFGWPLAYPWAVISSTFETLLRVPLGAAGAAAGTVTGLAIVPATHVAWPAAKAVWHTGVDGVLLPVAGWTWQTVAAPPAALFASAPTPSRADGTWMTVRKPQSAAESPLPHPAAPLPEAALASLALYARETADLAAQEAEANRKDQEEREALEGRQRQARQARVLARAQRLQAWAQAPEHRRALEDLVQAGGDPASLRASRQDLERRLEASGLSREQARETLDALIRHPLRKNPPQPGPSAPPSTSSDKTDPLRGALETVDRVTGLPVGKR